MAPVAFAIARHPRMAHKLIASGQQADLFDEAISAFGVRIDEHLGDHRGGDMHVQMQRLEASISNALVARNVDLVLVQGDTNTALAAARAATKSKCMVGHVEAGLRSHNIARPFPEEANRIEIAQLATVHFAPSKIAAQNLANEGIHAHVFITGNPGIDAMLKYNVLPCAQPKSHILFTCHRRENFGVPLSRICNALIEIMNRTGQTVLIPVHPNPNVNSVINAAFAGNPLAKLIDPLPYRDMISAIRTSVMVISDSGGLQEECAALGIPLLLLRDETERPEVIMNGNAIIVGTDPARIVAEAIKLIFDAGHRAAMSKAFFPYGRGKAASQIVDAIDYFFECADKPNRR